LLFLTNEQKTKNNNQTLINNNLNKNNFKQNQTLFNNNLNKNNFEQNQTLLNNNNLNENI